MVDDVSSPRMFLIYDFILTSLMLDILHPVEAPSSTRNHIKGVSWILLPFEFLYDTSGQALTLFAADQLLGLLLMLVVY